jgi:hypothetical protein
MSDLTRLAIGHLGNGIDVYLASDVDALLAERDAEIARLRTDMKAAFHELGGIGAGASLQFHRIGIDSARGILRRSLHVVTHE